ncbi:MAG: hypothetical protein IJC84_02435 [Clostridia bacterium]|nr:hypothetical protein [Clostridia bacterium]
MKLPLSLSRDRFARRFAAKVAPLSPLAVDAFGNAGRLRGDRFVLWHKKKGSFALFSCVLRGRIAPDGASVSYRFSRPLWVAIPWTVWLCLMAAAGLSVIVTDLLFGLAFLLPALLLALPLFLFSKRERAALIALLSDLTGA